MRLDHGGPGFAVACRRLLVAKLPTGRFFKCRTKRCNLRNGAGEFLARHLFDVQSQRSGLVAGHGLGKVGGVCASLPVNRQAFHDPYNFASAVRLFGLQVSSGRRCNRTCSEGGVFGRFAAVDGFSGTIGTTSFIGAAMEAAARGDHGYNVNDEPGYAPLFGGNYAHGCLGGNRNRSGSCPGSRWP